jgi:hypothetical protein
MFSRREGLGPGEKADNWKDGSAYWIGELRRDGVDVLEDGYK